MPNSFSIAMALFDKLASDMNVVMPVILCSGSGAKLWPLSRSGFPKHFLCLTGEESLFQKATKRLMALNGHGLSIASPLIVTNEEHRLANPVSIPLEIIEVQSGSYLGEDDIVRFEDRYGRSAK